MAVGLKKKSATFAKGGSGKMFGKQSAAPQKPGNSGKGDDKDGAKFAKGGSGKMFGKQSAETQTPGKSGKC